MVTHDVTPNPRVGAYYAAAALLLMGAAAAAWPWGVALVWPAVACGIVAAGYAGAGPRIYRKRDGRLPLPTRVLMAPVLLGQELSLRHYRRHGHAWDEAMPGLLMGRILAANEAEALLGEGVTAVLDVTAEFTEAEALRQANYLNLPILDLTAPTPEQLQCAVEFIRANLATGAVYVHCKIGYSRTAAVVGSYLLAAGIAQNADDAIQRLRDARSPMVIRPEVVDALRKFAAGLDVAD